MQPLIHSLVAFAADASGLGTWRVSLLVFGSTDVCCSLFVILQERGSSGGRQRTLTHFARQLTSSAAHAPRQEIRDAVAASVLVAEAVEVSVLVATVVETEEEDGELLWALAKTAKAPATRKAEKRMLTNFAADYKV